MAAEITVTIWTDAPATPSLAHSAAVEAAAIVNRSTGQATAVAAFDARAIQPTDCVEVELPEPVPAPTLVPDEDAIEWQDTKWVPASAYEAARADLAEALRGLDAKTEALAAVAKAEKAKQSRADKAAAKKDAPPAE